MKSTKHIIFMIVLLTGVFGCGEDYLELTNPNVQTTDTFWKTEDDVEKGVNAIYQSLAIYDGSFMRFAQIALDLRGDDVMSPSPWDVLANTGSFRLANNSIMQQWLWIAFYGVVFRANQVLTNIDNVEFADQARKDQYMGEALFLRSVAYFYLINFFHNIPLLTDVFEKPEDYYPNQEDPQLVWQQIYTDLQEASQLLPISYSQDIGRATKGAAMAFLGKAYLFNQEYTQAAAHFKSVIDLGIYDLMENYEDNFTEAHENNQESIFEIQFERNVGGTVLGWVGAPAADWSLTTARAITFAPAPFGWGDAAPTRWIVDEFLKEKTVDGEDDPRLRASIFYNYPGATLYGQSFQEVYATELDKIGVKKYGNSESGRPDEKDWRSGINERIMRYADVLLMYAECLNELGNTAEAAHYIQMVRNRVNLPDREAEFAGYTQEQLREQLAHERALEFVLEGHRFYDIKRWGWLEDPARLAELQQHDPEFNSYVPGREYFSIPQAEIETNPNLLQNSGY